MISILHNTKTGEVFDTDDHQHEAYAHLMKHKRAALFLGMGMSKTVTALSYLYTMHYEEAAITKTLVIAPDKVARLTWPNEIDQWAHLKGMRYSVIAGDNAAQRDKALAADADIYIIGIDNLVWLLDKYVYKNKSGKWVGKVPFDCAVMDELSLFKNPSSARFKKWARAIKTIDYRIGMTGTPSPNGYQDLWAPFMLLDGGERLLETFGKFTDKYFTTRGNGMIVYEYKPRPGAVQTISKKIADITLSMKTEDYIDLQPYHLQDIELEFDEFDQEVYDTLEREYTLDFINGKDVTVKTPADLTNKLLQITSGAIYQDKDDMREARVWHTVNTRKIEALGELLDEFPDETFIVVYQFRHEVDRILEAFPFARQFRKGKKIQEDFDDWNAGRIRLLLIHPASAGHGLNLQFGGRRMVWFSCTWNLEHWLQTTRRILRRGALWAIYMHCLIIKGTRDVKVRKRVEVKDSDQNFLLNEIKELRQKHGGKKQRQKVY